MPHTDGPDSTFCNSQAVASEINPFFIKELYREIHCTLVSHRGECFRWQHGSPSRLPAPSLGVISDHSPAANVDQPLPSLLDLLHPSFRPHPFVPSWPHISALKHPCPDALVWISSSGWPQPPLLYTVVEYLPSAHRRCSVKRHRSCLCLRNVNLNWRCVSFPNINTEIA